MVAIGGGIVGADDATVAVGAAVAVGVVVAMIGGVVVMMGEAIIAVEEGIISKARDGDGAIGASVCGPLSSASSRSAISLVVATDEQGLGSIGGVGAGFLGLALGVLGGTASGRLPFLSALDMNRGGRGSRTSVCGNHTVDVVEVD